MLLSGHGSEAKLRKVSTLPGVQAMVHDWVIKGLGMSSQCHVYATGHIKDSVPLIAKSRASCPSGRFPSSFIHQESSSLD